VVLTPDPALPVDPRAAAATAAALGALASALASDFGALVLTGGETARAVLDALGVGRLDVVRELEPGVVLSRAPGLPVLLVTKAGAFGDAGSLVRVATLLTASS
ncbi:MAG: nucleotide-binding domain containing protein, partial [Amnibacterium sp.]